MIVPEYRGIAGTLFYGAHLETETYLTRMI